jgi:hypothetical protein
MASALEYSRDLELDKKKERIYLISKVYQEIPPG